LLGYIRISLKQEASFGTVASNWQYLMQQLMWMCVFAVMIGVMLRSSLQWFSHRLVSNRQLHHTALDSSEHLPTDNFSTPAAKEPPAQ